MGQSKAQPTLLFQFIVYSGTIALFAALVGVSGRGGVSGVLGLPAVLVGIAVVWFLLETDILPKVLIAVLARKLDRRTWLGRLFLTERRPVARADDIENPFLR